MVFSSLLFVLFFLPVLLVAYYAVPASLRNAVALLGSLFFYAWGEPVFMLILLLSSTLDFTLTRNLASTPTAGRRRAILIAAITYNIGLLAYFKYANFFVAQLNNMLAAAATDPIPWRTVALPIGVSFFTFHKLSYILDVYWGTVQPSTSLLNYLLYISLFPQLIAGPIVRYHDVATQLEQRSHTPEKFLAGVWRFSLGMGKKVLIANALAKVADAAFSLPTDQLPGGTAWLGLLAYTFQIYFDFSGYSDMAIGLGLMMGFRFLENFNRPYVATDFVDFWRRWHISLSRWMKDYLYVPLGGNRSSTLRTTVNLWTVFLLSGAWHGASWNFLAWGAFHGLFITLSKVASPIWRSRMPRFFQQAATFILVMLGWVLFRSNDLPHAVRFIGRLFSPATFLGPTTEIWQTTINHRAVLVLVLSSMISLTPLQEHIRVRCSDWQLLLLRAAGVIALLSLSLGAMVNQDFNPFIYFRF